MNYINLLRVREIAISKLMVKLGILETVELVENMHNQISWERLVERIWNEGN
jgi:hypothetical protein